MAQDEARDQRVFTPRRVNETNGEDGQEAGFLYLSSSNPWPDDEQQALERFPEDWLEDAGAGLRVKRNRRPQKPQPVFVGVDGCEHDDGVACHFGFVLDIERGYWARNEQDVGDKEDPQSARTEGERGLRGGVLRLPDELLQPARAQVAGPPTHP